MSGSLQDQLKALGLAGDKPKNTQKKSSRRPGNTSPKHTGGECRKPGEFSLQKAYALKKQDEQRKADRARNRKLAEDRQRRLLNNEIRSIVKAHRLNRDDAEIGRNFIFRGRIRKLNVTAEQLKALNAGESGIAYLSGGYHLLAGEQVKAVRQISEEHIVDLSVESGDDGDHPVPDDIS